MKTRVTIARTHQDVWYKRLTGVSLKVLAETPSQYIVDTQPLSGMDTSPTIPVYGDLEPRKITHTEQVFKGHAL